MSYCRTVHLRNQTITVAICSQFINLCGRICLIFWAHEGAYFKHKTHQWFGRISLFKGVVFMLLPQRSEKGKQVGLGNVGLRLLHTLSSVTHVISCASSYLCKQAVTTLVLELRRRVAHEFCYGERYGGILYVELEK